MRELIVLGGVVWGGTVALSDPAPWLDPAPPWSRPCPAPPGHLAANVLVNQHVLALVVEDDMHLLGSGTTDIWAWGWGAQAGQRGGGLSHPTSSRKSWFLCTGTQDSKGSQSHGSRLLGTLEGGSQGRLKRPPSVQYPATSRHSPSTLQSPFCPPFLQNWETASSNPSKYRSQLGPFLEPGPTVLRAYSWPRWG